MLAGFDGLIMATSATASRSLYEADLTGPVAMIFGSEGAGIGEAFQSVAKEWVTISMAPGVESLNVAAATTLCLFERVRQLHHAG